MRHVIGARSLLKCWLRILNGLCPDCEEKFLDEQIDVLPKRCFEYKIEQLIEMPFLDILNKAGSDGWELVSVDNRDAYFKREKFEDI